MGRLRTIWPPILYRLQIEDALRHARALIEQSVLRWPKPELILAAVQRWAEAQQALRPALTKVGVFGS